MKEIFIIASLYLFDFVMNVLTLGAWNEAAGEERVIVKIRKQN
jgi:hypothetical protein